MHNNIVIDNQIQGTAAKIVVGFAILGFVVTVVKVTDIYRAKKKEK